MADTYRSSPAYAAGGLRQVEDLNWPALRTAKGALGYLYDNTVLAPDVVGATITSAFTAVASFLSDDPALRI